MHYLNGREALDGDNVFGREWDGTPFGGVLKDLLPGTETCNATCVSAGNGYPDRERTVTVGDLIHADDVLTVNDGKTSLAGPAAPSGLSTGGEALPVEGGPRIPPGQPVATSPAVPAGTNAGPLPAISKPTNAPIAGEDVPAETNAGPAPAKSQDPANKETDTAGGQEKR